MIVEGDRKQGYLEVKKVDVATMRSTELGRIEPEHWPDVLFGLVPGGRYFYKGSQVLDRRTLKSVTVKELRGIGLESLVSALRQSLCGSHRRRA